MKYIHILRALWVRFRLAIIVGAISAAMLLLTFVWGYASGSQDVRTPIIIEMNE